MHIVTPERMRQIEGYAITALHIDGLILMERAALRLAQEVRAGGAKTVLCVCGIGNNGGDAYACARMLHLWGVKVYLLPLCPMEKLHGDALKNAIICQSLSIPTLSPAQAKEMSFDAAVDGIFGTGLSRAPEGVFAEAIALLNTCGASVFAVDIPSGIDGATGQVLGEAVHADATVTFQWAKPGHYLYPGALYTGRLLIADIGIPDPAQWMDAELLDQTMVDALLPHRARDAYKNQFGHALLLAGSRGMAGAALLCGTACLRAGAGLLTVCASEKSVMPVLQAQLPAAMCLPLPEQEGCYPPNTASLVRDALCGKSAVGYGCGIGRGADKALPLDLVLHSNLPGVIDADGLYHLSAHLDDIPEDNKLVLTPHPGEMARLQGRPVVSPVEDAQSFAKAHHVVVLLKGACTVIAAPDGRLTFNVLGTPGMATAGSGDTLTGIILALLAQGLSPYDAARVGAYLHSQAGLRAEKDIGTASMTAWDMAQRVRA